LLYVVKASKPAISLGSFTLSARLVTAGARALIRPPHHVSVLAGLVSSVVAGVVDPGGVSN